MPVTGRYLFTASMDIPKEQEALFNEVYDKEHVPLLSSVPGVVVGGALQEAGTDACYRRRVADYRGGG